jgi:hypothetical protein
VLGVEDADEVQDHKALMGVIGRTAREGH